MKTPKDIELTTLNVEVAKIKIEEEGWLKFMTKENLELVVNCLICFALYLVTGNVIMTTVYYVAFKFLLYVIIGFFKGFFKAN